MYRRRLEFPSSPSLKPPSCHFGNNRSKPVIKINIIRSAYDVSNLFQEDML